MTAPSESQERQARDEVDELLDAAHSLAGRPGRDPALNWPGVWTAARRRRMQHVAAAAAISAVAAGGLAAVVFFALPVGETAPRILTSPPRSAWAEGVEEFRLLRPAPGIQVIAEREAGLRVLTARELQLDSGTVWVRIDAPAGPVPFDVVTRDARVSVVGTRFAVSARAGAPTTVAVLEGRVRVQTADAEVVVDGGSRWETGAGYPAPLNVGWRESLVAFLGELPAAPSGRTEESMPVPDAPSEVPPEAGGGATMQPVPIGIGPGMQPELPSPLGGTGGNAGSGNGPAGAPAMPEAADAESLYRQAEQAMAAGRLEEAVRLLEQVTERARGTPLGGMALMDLAGRRQQLGQPEAAADAYRRYVAENPNGTFRGEARIALCRIALRAGRDDEARGCYAAYLAEQPDGPYADEAGRGSSEEELR